MATTTGLVQKVIIIPNASTACAWIGASPTNNELLFVERPATASAGEGAFQNSLVDVLTTAMTARREVVAIHDANNARIDSLRIDPA
jgi:hypothetical protein